MLKSSDEVINAGTLFVPLIVISIKIYIEYLYLFNINGLLFKYLLYTRNLFFKLH